MTAGVLAAAMATMSAELSTAAAEQNFEGVRSSQQPLAVEISVQHTLTGEKLKQEIDVVKRYLV